MLLQFDNAFNKFSTRSKNVRVNISIIHAEIKGKGEKEKGEVSERFEGRVQRAEGGQGRGARPR